MNELLQDITVTIVALGASGLIVRRVVGFVAPKSSSGCSSCPTANDGCAAPTTGAEQAQPLVLIRPQRRSRRPA